MVLGTFSIRELSKNITKKGEKTQSLINQHFLLNIFFLIISGVCVIIIFYFFIFRIGSGIRVVSNFCLSIINIVNSGTKKNIYFFKNKA